MKKNFFLAAMSFFALTLGACSGTSSSDTSVSVSEEQFEEIVTRDTYTNKFGEEYIPGQWADYGVGDPFVMRWNGKYYLYCSTKDYQTGVRGWVSEDLINWTQMTGEGLDTGYVSNDSCTLSAYAPEVLYWNGYFYMVQSQGGNGHYILRSSLPEGPFTAITGNFGESIDGSFFVDDDETIYLLRASNTGIRIVQLNDSLEVETSRTLDNTTLGGWTEGPYVIKRDGTYYLTYTGNSVTSEGYRIGYSYSTDQIFSRSAFTQGDTIVLNTDSDFKGLGHSSTVLGPDLDSYYLVYHNLNSSGGPNRSYNLSRLDFNGTQMIVNHPKLYNNYVPDTADFSSEDADGLVNSGNTYLADAEHNGETFSVEWNFKGEDTNLLFDYQDADNYSYISVAGGDITLRQVSNGTPSTLASATFTKTYDLDALHTVQISNGEGRTIVYFDKMAKIRENEFDFNGGDFGFEASSSSNVCALTMSDKANGSSDAGEVHQDVLLASDYYSSEFSDASGLTEEVDDEEIENFNGKLGSYDLLLNNSGDSALYRFAVDDDGYYGLSFTLEQKYAGQKVLLQVDGKTTYRCTVPEYADSSTQYYNATLLELELTAGAHYLRIVAEDDEFAFNRIDFYLSSSVWPSFEHDLSNYVETGATYMTSWKINDGGHYALSGNRNLLYLGDGTITDCTIEVDIELVGETQANSAGIILRADNPAFSTSDSVTSIQGYYVGLNNSKCFVTKCNYDRSSVDSSADAYSFASDESHHLKVTIEGNRINASFDEGDVELVYNDSVGFNAGYVGLYTDGAASIFRNLKIYHE